MTDSVNLVAIHKDLNREPGLRVREMSLKFPLPAAGPGRSGRPTVRAGGCGLLTCFPDRVDGVQQSDVRERLREVAQQAFALGVVLLAEETDIVSQRRELARSRARRRRVRRARDLLYGDRGYDSQGHRRKLRQRGTR